MERISIFNYEAFYLDFLEGNLSEQDTALLLAFLEKNPSLELMDSDLPSLGIDDSSLSFLDKESLKQVDEKGIINLNNVEHFLIGQQEGILSEEKSIELDDFVNGKPALEKERGYIQSAVLVVDSSIIYQDKGGLKQKKVIVFWPYVASLAAACLLFFVWINLNGNAEVPQVADKKTNDTEKVIETPSEQGENQKNLIAKDENPSELIPERVIQQNPVVHYSVGNPTIGKEDPKTPKQQRVERLQRRALKTGVASVDEMEIESIVTAKSYGNPTDASEDPLWGFGNTKNPIEPITAGIKKRFNTDVDFRSEKATDKKPGGFFLKIGKFELARKKH